MLRRIRSSIARLRALGACASGAALVETAAAAPFITLLLAGIYDLGTGMFRSMALEGAARAGAEYYVRHPNDLSGAQTAVRTASGMAASTLNVSVSLLCECPNGTSISCTSGTCATPGPLTRFVSVQVTQAFASLLPYPGFLRPTQLTGNIVMRL